MIITLNAKTIEGSKAGVSFTELGKASVNGIGDGISFTELGIASVNGIFLPHRRVCWSDAITVDTGHSKSVLLTCIFKSRFAR